MGYAASLTIASVGAGITAITVNIKIDDNTPSITLHHRTGEAFVRPMLTQSIDEITNSHLSQVSLLPTKYLYNLFEQQSSPWLENVAFDFILQTISYFANYF